MRNKIVEIITIKVYKKGIYILLSGWKCTKEHEESSLGTQTRVQHMKQTSVFLVLKQL